MIYIVKSSRGSFDDYSCWNEKAFLNKEDAEKYAKELDKKHFYKPEFITPQFEKLIIECEGLLPNWEPWNDFPITDENRDAYFSYQEKMRKQDINLLIKMMYERGQFITETMYDQFNEWYEDQYRDWFECEIEELELV